ncbi:MAG: hypothetical protein IJ654_01360 [Bacteroidales bacterium]|nr:hypothetical protein [Bacteroidales bacterium]
MKRITFLLAAVFCTASLFAQTSRLPDIREITSVENENTGETVAVVNIPVDSISHYWLHLGNMGIGNKTVQINLDPVYNLYIPLGGSVAEAVATMEELKTLLKEPKGTRRDIQGSFKPFFPSEQLETIQVYKFKLIVENKLQFVLERDGYERVAYLAQSEFNSLLRGLKLYGKIHPSQDLK